MLRETFGKDTKPANVSSKYSSTSTNLWLGIFTDLGRCLSYGFVLSVLKLLETFSAHILKQGIPHAEKALLVVDFLFWAWHLLASVDESVSLQKKRTAKTPWVDSCLDQKGPDLV